LADLQRFNFAEAVNFATWDWLDFGLRSVAAYQKTEREPVFSIEEFICSVAGACVVSPNSVDCRSARVIHTMLTKFVVDQADNMNTLIQSGVVKSTKMVMEVLSDDARECPACKATVFLYSIRCSCSGRFACLEHAAQLCQCPADQKTIVYRYNHEELAEFGQSLNARALVFESWKEKIKSILQNIETAFTQRDNEAIVKFDIEPIEDVLSAAEADWCTDEEVAVLESKVLLSAQ
jgi:histone demethylase JARID1